MPQVFEWALFVAFQPVFAGIDLCDHHEYTNNEAPCDTDFIGKTKSIREEDNASDDGLTYVVGQTHFAVIT